MPTITLTPEEYRALLMAVDSERRSYDASPDPYYEDFGPENSDRIFYGMVEKVKAAGVMPQEDVVKTLTVTEEVEVILDGKKYLLEKGDKVVIGEVRRSGTPGFEPVNDYPVADSDELLSEQELIDQNFRPVECMAYYKSGIFYFLLPKQVAFAAGQGPESPADKAWLPLRVD